MVLIQDGSSEHVAHVWSKIGFFREEIFFDETKCLQQIEILDLLHMCAPGSKLPSYIDTINKTEENKNSEEGRKHILWQK